MEEIIKKYLEERAKEDATIAANLKKENKSIANCCKYITEQARKEANHASSVMIADDVVFGWAIHYFDEDGLDIDKPKPQPKAKPAAKPASKPASKPKDKAQKQPKAKAVITIYNGTNEPAEGKKTAKKQNFVQCDLFGELGL